MMMAEAKVGLGGCPGNLTLAPWSANMTGTYYVQNVEKTVSRVSQFVKNVVSQKGLDCYSAAKQVPEDNYGEDQQPFSFSAVPSSNILFFDETYGTMIEYWCFDADFLADVQEANQTTPLAIPQWANGLFKSFSNTLPTQYFSVMAVLSKNLTMEP